MLVRMNAATAGGETRLLADGNQVPVLGLGVWQVHDGPECVNAVRWALEAGYRHIDTAQAYGNEESVGRALRDSGVLRDQVFITTKFQPRRHDPVAEAEKSLRRLGVQQIDLYLVHWPQGSATRAWAGLERARELGLARSIGVSNFSAADLDAVIAAGTIPPAVNQVEFNPQHYRGALLDACGRHNLAVEAYARSAPAGTSPTPPWPRSPGRRAGRQHRCCCAGACSAASSSSPSQRTAPHPPERADLRLCPVSRRHGRTRRARSDRRHRPRPRSQLVVVTSAVELDTERITQCP
jgi:hypothetical protein